ncbi:MAG: hypothetical protein ABI776_15000 [Nocardioidaceae bacterium]
MSTPTQSDQTGDVTPPQPVDPHDAMRAAKPPVGTGPAPLVAQLVALGLVALGVVGIQEALVRSGIVSATSWTSATISGVDGLRVATWALVLGVALVVAGLLLLPIVVKRRPRKTLTLAASTGVHIRTRDLARLCEHVVAGADAVTDVHAKAAARRVRVTATTVGPPERNQAIADDVRSRLATTLDALERTPRLKVSVKNEGL